MDKTNNDQIMKNAEKGLYEFVEIDGSVYYIKYEDYKLIKEGMNVIDNNIDPKPAKEKLVEILEQIKRSYKVKNENKGKHILSVKTTDFCMTKGPI